MSNKHITIGIANSDIGSIRTELEQLLELSFSEHESSYKGKYFLCKVSDCQKIELGSNFEDGDWREGDYKDYPLLLKLISLESASDVTTKVLQNIKNAIFIKALETKAGEYLRVYDFADGQFVLSREKILK